MSARQCLVATIVAVMTLAGCGVPTDDEPREISGDRVPFDLLAPSTTQPPTTIATQTEAVTVYLLDQERLVPVTRTVAETPLAGTVLATLIQGPTDGEAANGLLSAINPRTSVIGAMANGPVAVVNISESFMSIAVQDQIRALAQVVYTATELPGVESVQIQIDGEDAAVPRGDGSTTREPLIRQDYQSLAPLPAG